MIAPNAVWSAGTQKYVDTRMSGIDSRPTCHKQRVTSHVSISEGGHSKGNQSELETPCGVASIQ